MTLNERIDMTYPSHPIFPRLYDQVMKPAERTVLLEHRRYLVDDISGAVLDLGVGTGAMYPYFREAVADGQNITRFAIEPDSHMRRKAAVLRDTRPVFITSGLDRLSVDASVSLSSV